MLEHGVRDVIRDEEGDVVALRIITLRTSSLGSYKVLRTFTGFLLSTMKLSARCIMKRVNL